jgi:hypothetical protein
MQSPFHIQKVQFLLLILLALLFWPHSSGAEGAGGRVVQVNIFGEDNRIGMDSPQWNNQAHRPWNIGAGTIHCDGRNRGSAAIIDTSEWGGDHAGLVIATSAHVLFDLEDRQRFESCRFHYMGLDKLPGYQAPVSLQHWRMGSFDPHGDPASPAFGREDWAFLYVEGPMPGVPLAGRFRVRPFAELVAAQAGEVRFNFMAFSPSNRGMAISTSCQVIESTAADLGGGAWKGQLLDDCDSEGGASGGALVATVLDEHFLVGIRNGSHWDGGLFPVASFPQGFSRAIDRELLQALKSLVEEIGRAEASEVI